MHIGIIGAGFTGLAAGYELTKQGHRVTIIERDDQPGGLAVGYKESHWEWSIEKHYHHWFTNDIHALTLAKTIGHPVVAVRPKTSVYVQNAMYQLDSPYHVLTFPLLSPIERMRMGLALAVLRYNPLWQPFEYFSATRFLPSFLGTSAYKLLWEPLFWGKFKECMNDVSMVWFWNRIKKRTPILVYPQGGYLSFAKHLEREIINTGLATISYNTVVTNIRVASDNRVTLRYGKTPKEARQHLFDKIVVTLPVSAFVHLAPQLPHAYISQLLRLKGLGAVNVILRLRKQFLTDGTYWLNICDMKAPLMAVVEHTNFMDTSHYNNEHLVYIGNYVSASHPYTKMNAQELLAIFSPYLKKLNPHYEKEIIGIHVHKTPFAQPLVTKHYGKLLPAFQTPLPNVYLSNMQQVYPWDRGTTYAIDYGQRVVAQMLDGGTL